MIEAPSSITQEQLDELHLAIVTKEKKAAEEKGEEYHSDEEKDEEDPVPYITKKMLLSSLSGAKRSVTKADLEKHMKYKRDLERRLGMDESGEIIEQKIGPVIGLEPEIRPGRSGGAAPAAPAAPAPAAAAPSATPAAAPRSFGDEAPEDDSIYDQ
jgi:hypothetical protein